jgi:hypothetical protein
MRSGFELRFALSASVKNAIELVGVPQSDVVRR